MLEEIGKRSKEASFQLSELSTKEKNTLLVQIKDELISNQEAILDANALDMDNGVNNNLADSLLDRLLLTEERLMDMVSSIDVIIGLDDPVGRVDRMFRNDDDLLIGRQTTPLGVLGIIYESRPNVTLDASCLALKSSNTIILRGGEEAINSNREIANTIRTAIESLGYNPDFVQFIDDTSRESSNELMKLDKYVDVLIPRGGRGLIQAVKQNSTVPVIETGEGNSSIYVDEFANIDMAIDIIENAKCQRTGVCNAIESLYVHKNVDESFYEKLNEIIRKNKIKVHAEERLLEKIPGSILATEEDYFTEYLAMEMSIKTVDTIDQAIKETMVYGSGHSDSIITESYENALKYQAKVNSACVYINASTRFTDGGQFGLGAELGISTQKLHARGPVGLEELTSYKYIIFGQGQVRK